MDNVSVEIMHCAAFRCLFFKRQQAAAAEVPEHNNNAAEGWRIYRMALIYVACQCMRFYAYSESDTLAA